MLYLERNLAACGFLRQMGEQEWTEMCKSLIGAALTDGEMDFAVDLFIPLMGEPDSIAKQLTHQLGN